MNDYYQNDQPQPEPNKKENKKMKSFISMITAGVIGSAITLGAVNYTDFPNKENANTAQTETGATSKTGPGKLSTNIVPASTASRAETGSIADMVEKSSKAIVGIVNIQEQNQPFMETQSNVPAGSGSGVIFKKTGDGAFIVTNNHVIEGASSVEVSLYNGEKATAEVVGADALTDLAVIKIDAKHASEIIDFADSSGLRPGDQVMAIGNPLGLDLSRTVTQGIVSAINREIAVSTSAGEWKLSVIQTDAAINPGNSGGALINTSGQVVGINSLKISESGVEGLGFAIPSNDVVPIVNEMIETGKVERPYMGVGLADFGEIPGTYLQNLPQDVKAGTMITHVEPGSAAAKAGLQEQDVIVSINKEKVENSSDLRRFMYSHIKVGETVSLELYRNGKAVSVKVKMTNNQSN